MNANLADMVAFRTQALHIQEAFYERLFTNSPEAIIVLDRRWLRQPGQPGI